MSDTPQPDNWRISEWFPALDATTHKRLTTYHEELHKFNRTLNLVSSKTLAFDDVIHFADSILACQAINEADPKMSEVYDFGSGNGFPGMVYAILYPHVKVILLDSDQRKCEFLKHLTTALSITNVQVKCAQVESLPAGSVDRCMARGFASISKAILIARKVVKTGGVFYHLKSDGWSAEVGEIPTQLCSSWSPALVKEYKLPIGPIKFAVVKTDKIG